MKLTHAFIAAALLAASAGLAWCQTDQPVAPAASVAPATAIEAPASIRIPAGTVVLVELTEALNSETSRQQQLFGLRLVEPIVIDGREVVPAGVAGGGEVIDAHPSAFGGRQGRLIISGRYIEIDGQRARIRSMQITGAGEDRANVALGVGAVVGLPAFLIQGGEIHMPAGTRASARLAVDVDLPINALATDAAPTQQPQEGEHQQ